MENSIEAMRHDIEVKCRVFLGWTIPAREKQTGMRFCPITVADYLCGLSDRVPIGAVHQYVWTMAFANSRAVAATAMRNLCGLFDGVHDFGPDWSEELPS